MSLLTLILFFVCPLPLSAHTYERMCPMKNMKCVPSAEGGITYITVGSAGATVHNRYR
jgi:hypothetical protein